MANTRGKRKEVEPVDEVMNTAAAETTETAETEAPSNKKGTVICQNLNVRKEPALGSAILRVITKGTEVEILDDADDTWYKVCVGDIGTGFCMKEFVKLGK